MMIRDQKLGHMITAYGPEWLIPFAITVGVLALGIWHKKYRKGEGPSEEEHKTEKAN